MNFKYKSNFPLEAEQQGEFNKNKLATIFTDSCMIRFKWLKFCHMFFLGTTMFRNCLNIMTKVWRIAHVQTSLIRPEFQSSLVINKYPMLQQQQIRTFKDKDVLKLRCGKCYFKKIDDRWWVLCNEHPRHKQRQKLSRIQQQDRMIVTHITRTGSYKKKHFQYIYHDI
ncbi:39S ribosomal protein L36, mitochondrial-like protein [Euroglyphus maynei]|uniref:Large ribosomal subunit protein bL36m n=1 Tax=Euroglyphus maynei TaxID=6958 RepID=A0A1Y3BP43_EURMA|nr:39S ribosomal protein L36, mitochondrial-like protein [Euroglyphus maynei]